MLPSLVPLLFLAAADATAQPLPPSALAVRQARAWHTWWSSEAAPARWPEGLEALAAAVRWRPVRDGVERGDLRISCDGEAWRLGIVLLRLDPARVRFGLEQATRAGGLQGAWSVDAAEEAVLALNAGQFAGGRPWGWVVHDGRETGPPGTGPLSAAFVVYRDGGVALLGPEEITEARRAGEVALAFQSYPALLTGDGEVPAPLRARGGGVDLGHRDSRLALGLQRDGRVLLALTRFEGLGGALSSLPFGLTTPEMAALMGALGCRTAFLLDGGLSAQLLVRSADGATHAWRGMRRVPLGLVGYPRTPALTR